MKSQTLPQVRLHTSYQMLVNQSHPLPPLAAPDLAAPDPACPDVLMERHAAALLSACIRAVNGAGKIIPVSGWRSHEEQRQIWNDTLAKEGPVFTRNYVAFPGCSEHESGLAIDLALAAPEIDFIRPEFPYTGVCGEFRRLAPRYGFVERYRVEKQSTPALPRNPGISGMSVFPMRSSWKSTVCAWKNTLSFFATVSCNSGRKTAAGQKCSISPICPHCPTTHRATGSFPSTMQAASF